MFVTLFLIILFITSVVMLLCSMALQGDCDALLKEIKQDNDKLEATLKKLRAENMIADSRAMQMDGGKRANEPGQEVDQNV